MLTLTNKRIKHFNPKKKLVLSGVSALFTCSGAPPTSFFLGLKMFIFIDLFNIRFTLEFDDGQG